MTETFNNTRERGNNPGFRTSHTFLDKTNDQLRLTSGNRVNGGSLDETAAQKDWERWLEEHAPGLLLFARQQSRCEADAQDLVQEAVVESWQRLGNGEPPAVAVVFATIRRRAVDWARSQDRRTSREAVAHAEIPICWFDVSPEERERTQMIQEAMAKLRDIYREVLSLKTWGGLTFAQIGVVLEIPANTAASRYRYGLEELRKLLGGPARSSME
jgi:RNA polymerase sigma-70 factor (ECF subfamily)